ncbi:hypothetical protein [Thalassotalea ganghwensis]
MKKMTLFLFSTLFIQDCFAEKSEASNATIDDAKVLYCSAKSEQGKFIERFDRPADWSHCQQGDIIKATGEIFELVCDFSKPIIVNSYKNMVSCIYRGSVREDSAFKK